METHLKKGELEAMLLYFFMKENSQEDYDEIITQAFSEDVMATSLCIFLSEQNRASAMKYEETSSFGRSYGEIFRNAREHIAPCPRCFEEYKLFVLSTALGFALAGIRAFEKSNLEHPISFISEYHDYIRKNDSLNLLTLPGLFENRKG